MKIEPPDFRDGLYGHPRAHKSAIEEAQAIGKARWDSLQLVFF